MKRKRWTKDDIQRSVKVLKESIDYYNDDGFSDTGKFLIDDIVHDLMVIMENDIRTIERYINLYQGNQLSISDDDVPF